MSKCPCGTGREFKECCEPYIKGEAQPATAETLMRSRYSAYTLGDIAYIKRTSAPEALKEFDVKAAKEWAESAEWKGLKVLSVDKGGAEDKKGVVEFMATYKQDGKVLEHHEVSKFRKNGSGEWMFVDGDSHVHEEGKGHEHHHHHHVQETVVREGPKVGRNDPCPCGSGKKFKKCHGA
jgi:SEC-C motif-containing protein